MRFWTREILGWLLLVAGLGLFALSIVTVRTTVLVTQAAIIAFVGFIVFRGGVHFLKVAVAARVFMLSRAQPDPRDSQTRPAA